ncbi:hypothetical protein RFI_10079 [Reticulomyxa filosa]|uniref:Uncharacterized protein n=1 Tax=Reticulomyxa filosa TaxID=46433 RepID=X6NM99_RETFI|nr:hypothetical protein RFI_10079 [Reticulomyxa filosa]|eukprot:ETO27053.1 hypothetical protein RFI_10079 [Reticulomyxa filosa]
MQTTQQTEECNVLFFLEMYIHIYKQMNVNDRGMGWEQKGVVANTEGKISPNFTDHNELQSLSFDAFTYLGHQSLIGRLPGESISFFNSNITSSFGRLLLANHTSAKCRVVDPDGNTIADVELSPEFVTSNSGKTVDCVVLVQDYSGLVFVFFFFFFIFFDLESHK